MQTVRECSICGKTFRDSEGRRKKCHACRMGKIQCKRNGCRRTIYKANLNTGFCRFCLSKLEMNPNWKGGQITQQGYIMLRHPGGKYVFEHRVVMEKVLGRKLERNENVHHKNGIRTDNRPENLELWVCMQPSGQRVSDLVAWAEEILAKYKGA